ncbi:MAG: hypothetical protein PHT95_06335, partial [Candidatus Omnitrophica bacterium]|nr:hypothetical protein [Candidatus Omnitrophota bacterium]
YTTGNDHPVMWDDRRRIIYRPLMPSVPAGFYGSQKRFKVLVNAFVNAEGHVLRAQTVTTTGYPQIDMLASKYVESWMYEPRARRMTDEKPDRIEIELELGQSE